MKFVNRTPFTPMTFESRDLDGDPFQVVILKGTFRIDNERFLEPIPGQLPIAETDQFFGDPQASGLSYENDLAPFKYFSDIVINATAYAPGGRPSTHWMVSARVGKICKQLIVTGKRSWRHRRIGGWKINDPLPTIKIPIRYENAFGGMASSNSGDNFYPENPIGIGYLDNKHIEKRTEIPAPCIMCPDKPVMEIGKPVKPEGFSAIYRGWQPRLDYAGTYDQKWLENRKPGLPLDFNGAFYNCAHPDLIYDGYLIGNEKIHLKRVHPIHEDLRFQMPGYRILVTVLGHDGYRYGNHAKLDTLHMDVDELRAILVWRVALPLYDDGVNAIETFMDASN